MTAQTSSPPPPAGTGPLRTALIVLALAALANALYLAYLGLNTSAECVAGADCDAIVGSEYGTLFGVPVSVYAVGFYLLILGLAFWRSAIVPRTRWMLGLAWLGVIASAVFTFIQLVLLPGFCAFCFLNFLLVVAIAAVAGRLWRQVRGDAPFWSAEELVTLAVPAALVSFLLPLAGYGLFVYGQSFAEPASDDPVVAFVDGREVRLSTLDDRIQGQLRDLHEQRNEARMRALENLVIEEVADRRGMAPERLVQQGLSTVNTVTEEEITQFYEANQDRLPPGLSESQARSQIRNFLQQQQQQQAYRIFVQDLLGREGVRPDLPEPPGVEIPVAGPETITVGNPDAPVRIVEFSDLQCPACANAHEQVKALLAGPLGDEIFFEFRHFPLGQHAEAEPAARALTCADRQGRFAEAADLLFRNQNAWGGRDPVAYLTDRLDLDEEAFRACVREGAVAASVRGDRDLGVELGINSTPSFFVNGRAVRGVPTEEQVRRLVR